MLTRVARQSGRLALSEQGKAGGRDDMAGRPARSGSPGSSGAGPGELTDAEVIELSLRRPDCFGAIFERHAAEILRYAHARVGADGAEDVLAETFLAAFGRRAHYDLSRADARPWLYGIAVRQIGKRRRTEGRGLRVLARVPLDPEASVFEDRSADRVTAQQLAPRLSAVLSGLSRKDRELLLLIAWAGLTYDEAAQALQVPVSTVRSQLHRIRTRTRQALGGTNPAQTPA